MELHLTGNMERYMWSFDGEKYSQTEEPIIFFDGERLRLTFVNDTMMEHPIHLHGMWMELVNGSELSQPRKAHLKTFKPAERVSVDVDVDAPGIWAFSLPPTLSHEGGYVPCCSCCRSSRQHKPNRQLSLNWVRFQFIWRYLRFIYVGILAKLHMRIKGPRFFTLSLLDCWVCFSILLYAPAVLAEKPESGREVNPKNY